MLRPGKEPHLPGTSDSQVGHATDCACNDKKVLQIPATQLH